MSIEPAQPELIYDDYRERRRAYFLELDTLEQWPEHLDLQSPRFILFLACDFRQYPDDRLAQPFKRIYHQRASAVCLWGRDCSRAENHFDWVHVGGTLEAPGPGPVLMTTSHRRESIRKALWYFWMCPVIDEQWKDETRAWLAVVVGNPRWCRKTRLWLTDPYRHI